VGGRPITDAAYPLATGSESWQQADRIYTAIKCGYITAVFIVGLTANLGQKAA
jgi:hypothetical protein